MRYRTHRQGCFGVSPAQRGCGQLVELFLQFATIKHSHKAWVDARVAQDQVELGLSCQVWSALNLGPNGDLVAFLAFLVLEPVEVLLVLPLDYARDKVICLHGKAGNHLVRSDAQGSKIK